MSAAGSSVQSQRACRPGGDCLKCLDKDPVNRYLSAGSAADLQRFLRDDRIIRFRRVCQISERALRTISSVPISGT